MDPLTAPQNYLSVTENLRIYATRYNYTLVSVNDKTDEKGNKTGIILNTAGYFSDLESALQAARERLIREGIRNGELQSVDQLTAFLAKLSDQFSFSGRPADI